MHEEHFCKAVVPFGRRCAAFVLLGLLGFLLTGCLSPPGDPKSPLVDWNKRIGNYTYDLALKDLGVPAHSTRLPDGSLVADWLIKKGNPGSADTSDAQVQGGYVVPPLWDNPFPMGSSQTPTRYLRLTFGPDQKLTGWRKYWQYYKSGTG